MSVLDTTAEPARDYALSSRDFERVRRMIHARAGIALAPSKTDMVYSRLIRRLRALQLDSFSEYLSRLESDATSIEWEHFTNALTTNLTAFFRESHHFEVLRERLSAAPVRPWRIWCAAASTGEEPYSIAITVMEAFPRGVPQVEILATDIDTQVLNTAQRGVYPMERAQKLGDARLHQFFQKGVGPQSGYCRANQHLRELLTFQRLNLLDAKWEIEGEFDIIFCRNVMIYFDKPTQYEILRKLTARLRPDGLLMAGHSESFFHAADLVRPMGRTVYALSDALRSRRRIA